MICGEIKGTYIYMKDTRQIKNASNKDYLNDYI